MYPLARAEFRSSIALRALFAIFSLHNGLYLEIFVGTEFIRAASIPTWNIGQAVQVWLAPFRRACVAMARNLDQPEGSKRSDGAAMLSARTPHFSKSV